MSIRLVLFFVIVSFPSIAHPQYDAKWELEQRRRSFEALCRSWAQDSISSVSQIYEVLYASETLASSNFDDVTLYSQLYELVDQVELWIELIDKWRQSYRQDCVEDMGLEHIVENFLAEGAQIEISQQDDLDRREQYQEFVKWGRSDYSDRTPILGFRTMEDAWERIESSIDIARAKFPQLEKQIEVYAEEQAVIESNRAAELAERESRLAIEEERIAQARENERREVEITLREQELARTETVIHQEDRWPELTYDKSDIDKLTSYAVFLGRGTACGVDLAMAGARVGQWLDSTFGQDRATYQGILVAGIEKHMTQQLQGRSPDSCAEIRREISKIVWP